MVASGVVTKTQYLCNTSVTIRVELCTRRIAKRTRPIGSDQGPPPMTTAFCFVRRSIGHSEREPKPRSGAVLMNKSKMCLLTLLAICCGEAASAQTLEERVAELETQQEKLTALHSETSPKPLWDFCPSIARALLACKTRTRGPRGVGGGRGRGGQRWRAKGPTRWAAVASGEFASAMHPIPLRYLRRRLRRRLVRRR